MCASTYDDQTTSGPGKGDVNLVFICNKTHVLLAPSGRRSALDLVAWHRPNEAENHVVPFTAFKQSVLYQHSVDCLILRHDK